LDAETCERLFGVGGRVAGEAMIASEASERLDRRLEAEQQAVLARIAERNGRFFAEEIEKLEPLGRRLFSSRFAGASSDDPVLRRQV
jgi:hypothetical protein